MGEPIERESSDFSGSGFGSGFGGAFKVLCVSCGTKIREKASEDSYGLCLKCFYTGLAARLHAQKRATAGEFVSDR